MNGEHITALFVSRLRSLSVTDAAKGTSDTLKIEVEDSQCNIAAPEAGAKIEISMGYTGALRNMGTFIVDEFSYEGVPDVLKVSARAAPFADTSKATLKAIQIPKTRSWDATTLSTVAGKIAKEHGLILEMSADASAQATPHLDQTQESDINFLSRVCLDFGLLVKAAYERLIIMKVGSGVSTAGVPITTVTIKRSEVSQYSFGGMKRSAYTGVVARWHDNATGKEESVLEGSKDAAFHIQTILPDEETAKVTAKSTLARLSRQPGEFSVTMPGRTDLVAEGTVKFVGFRDVIDGIMWRIETAEHSLTKGGGYVTTIKGRPLVIEN